MRSTACRSPAWAIAGKWNSTDQVPQRAIDSGLIDRFGALDPTDGGDTYRYSGSVEWQRTRRQRGDQGHGLRHRLRPEPVLELHLLPRRSRSTAISSSRRITGSSPARKVSLPAARPLGRPRRCRTRSACSSATTTSPTSACITPQRASGSDTIRQDAVLQTSGAGLRAERDGVDAVAADAGRRARRRLPLRRRRGRSGERRHRRTPGSSARKAAPSSGRSAAPSSTSTPASASTATTRAARPSRAIRRPASRRIA